MERKLKIFLFSAICFSIGFGCRYCVEIVQNKEKKIPPYRYVGKTYEYIHFKKSSETGYIPTERIQKLKRGAVPDYETAAKIGIDVLSSMFGENTIMSQKPFNVELINDVIWYVHGTYYIYPGNNTAEILIQKSDGRILYYNLGK